jgi:hypothetical protein
VDSALWTKGDIVWAQWPGATGDTVYPAQVIELSTDGKSLRLKFGRSSEKKEFYDPVWARIADMPVLVHWNDGPGTLKLTKTAISDYLPTAMLDFKQLAPSGVFKRVRGQTAVLSPQAGSSAANTPKKRKTVGDTAKDKRASAADVYTVPSRQSRPQFVAAEAANLAGLELVQVSGPTDGKREKALQDAAIVAVKSAAGIPHCAISPLQIYSLRSCSCSAKALPPPTGTDQDSPGETGQS